MSDDFEAPRKREPALSRRTLLVNGATVAAASMLARARDAQAQAPGPARPPAGGGAEPTRAQIAAALPLDTLGLEHIGTVVPDVSAAAKFYSRVFNPALYKERAEPLRYYVTLDPGYIALGSRAGATKAFIDHACALLKSYDAAAMARRLEAEGLPAGRFGLVPDPDGLGLQVLGAPGGLAASTEPAGRLVDGDALVRPRGLSHIVVYAADVAKSAAFYRKFFGPETREQDGRVAFHAAHTRWIFEPVPPGETPRIDRFAVNVARFDQKSVASALEALGAHVVSASESGLRFRSPDGIGVELLPVDPARIWGFA
jgi:catechol 2,3-dioxygenase-like lactoylglutathione lyase family enzyme